MSIGRVSQIRVSQAWQSVQGESDHSLRGRSTIHSHNTMLTNLIIIVNWEKKEEQDLKQVETNIQDTVCCILADIG